MRMLSRGFVAAALAVAAYGAPSSVALGAGPSPTPFPALSPGVPPVRIDDAFATMSYACVSFTNLDPRTALEVDFILRFALGGNREQDFRFQRTGRFAPYVPIEGPAPNDSHANEFKLSNCFQLEAPDDVTGTIFEITRVRFESGADWPLPATPPGSASPSPTPKA